MNQSGYQIERLIKGFRAFTEFWKLPRIIPENNDDRVELTEQGVALSRAHGAPAIPRAASTEEISEARRPELVERELERRAGSFMEPPCVPEGAPSRFVKVRPPRAP